MRPFLLMYINVFHFIFSTSLVHNQRVFNRTKKNCYSSIQIGLIKQQQNSSVQFNFKIIRLYREIDAVQLVRPMRISSRLIRKVKLLIERNFSRAKRRREKKRTKNPLNNYTINSHVRTVYLLTFFFLS